MFFDFKQGWRCFRAVWLVAGYFYCAVYLASFHSFRSFFVFLKLFH